MRLSRIRSLMASSAKIEDRVYSPQSARKLPPMDEDSSTAKLSTESSGPGLCLHALRRHTNQLSAGWVFINWLPILRSVNHLRPLPTRPSVRKIFVTAITQRLLRW